VIGEGSEQPVFGARGENSVSTWSLDDRFFKPAHAQQLARELPNAHLERIENARSFPPEDEPARLAELIAGFVRGNWAKAGLPLATSLARRRSSLPVPATRLSLLIDTSSGRAWRNLSPKPVPGSSAQQLPFREPCVCRSFDFSRCAEGPSTPPSQGGAPLHRIRGRFAGSFLATL
jgi:hypothetical protein